MIVKKSVIAAINREYISKIKELIVIHYGKEAQRNYAICLQHIYGKRKVKFILHYNQSANEEVFTVKGNYTLAYGRSIVTVVLNVPCKFDFTDFNELYFDVLGTIYHEIEHHLQRLKVPFKEKITGYDTESAEYAEAPDEMEAYLREFRILCIKKKVPLKSLVYQTAERFGIYKDIFTQAMFRYIHKRKDLNIMVNEED